MKKGTGHIISKAVIFFLLTVFPAFFSGCGGEADTVTPAAISVSASGSLTGTAYPYIVSVYPDGSVNPQVDTQIVIVFSKPIALGTVAANISITPATTYTESLASGGYAVVLTPTADLLYNTAYTVDILTGIQDSVNGNNLSSGGSFGFTTASDTAPAERPRVISATRYPSGGATGVSKVLSYVEVTFTESVDNVTTGTFTITGGTIASTSVSLVAGTNNKTWRLNLNTATIDYGQTYTVNLSTAIYKLGAPTVFLYDAGNLTWNFTIETDPAIAAPTVNDIWVSAITDTTATIKFTTSKPVAQQDCYAVYDTTAGVAIGDPQFQESGLTTKTTLHTVTVTGLNPMTRYWFRGGIETAGGPPVDILSVAEINFYTAANATVNTVLTNAVNNQNGLVLLQTNGAGSYAFWVSNNSTIYGQFFNATTGVPEWTDPGGEAICTAGGQNGIISITDGFSQAVVVYNDSDSLYAKMVYDNVGTFTWVWGGGAGAQGTSLGLAIKAGSSYSACIVHEEPDIISSGVADMPDDGTATNLIYDANVNFSWLPISTWLDVNDLLAIDPGGGGTAWNNYTINNQTASPFDLFPYVLWTSGATNLGAFTDYFIVDADVTTAGTSDDGNTTTTLICSTGTNLLSIVSGDIVRIGALPGEWGIATGSGWTAPYFWVSIDRAIAGLGVGSAFTIYTNHAGPFTSEAVTNPLWDTIPTVLFNPGTTVLAGDYVVNENNNTAGATNATVVAIGVQDTNYALRLFTDIMNNGDIYSIVRLPSSATGVAVGYSTNVATNFNITDSHNPFGAVSPGDIIFNIDQNMSAMVTGAGAGSLTLTADIFNNINEKAIVYQKRGFLVTYVDSSNYIAARAFNIADGTDLGAAFNVCTNGTNSNPVAVSDGAGNAIIFYEKAGGIYVKKVSAKGEFLWADPADQSSDAGISVLAGYTIGQVLPDRALNSTGGAYLLAKNTAGTAFRLVRISGANGATLYDTANVTGTNPQIAVDSETGLINRVIVVYRNTHLSGGVNYNHIEARAYRSGPLWGGLPVIVSSNGAGIAYNCYQPSITMLDNTTAADGFYVSWFDGRYFNPSGYTIYAQRYDSGGAAQGSEIFVSMPASKGYDYALSMRLLYWNDGGTPYGLMPIWLDYRNYSGTGTDIYYQQITAP